MCGNGVFLYRSNACAKESRSIPKTSVLLSKVVDANISTLEPMKDTERMEQLGGTEKRYSPLELLDALEICVVVPFISILETMGVPLDVA